MFKYLERIKRPSLRWGLFFGLILGLFDIAYSYASSSITNTSLAIILSYVPVALFLFLSFYAARYAMRDSGKWASGFVAAIWASLIGVGMTCAISFVTYLVNISSVVANQQAYIKAHESAFQNMKPTDFGPSDAIIQFFFSYILVIFIPTAFVCLLGAGVAVLVRQFSKRLAAKKQSAQVEITPNS
jgi:hypothetical protein